MKEDGVGLKGHGVVMGGERKVCTDIWINNYIDQLKKKKKQRLKDCC